MPLLWLLLTVPFWKAHSGSPETMQVDRSFSFHSSMVTSLSTTPLSCSPLNIPLPQSLQLSSCGDSKENCSNKAENEALQYFDKRIEQNIIYFHLNHHRSASVEVSWYKHFNRVSDLSVKLNWSFCWKIQTCTPLWSKKLFCCIEEGEENECVHRSVWDLSSRKVFSPSSLLARVSENLDPF